LFFLFLQFKPKDLIANFIFLFFYFSFKFNILLKDHFIPNLYLLIFESTTDCGGYVTIDELFDYAELGGDILW